MTSDNNTLRLRRKLRSSANVTLNRRPILQVALRACEYARERCLFIETIFVSLQDATTGSPITTLKEVSARIATGFGPLLFGSVMWPILGLPLTFAMVTAFVVLAVVWMAYAAPETKGRELDTLTEKADA